MQHVGVYRHSDYLLHDLPGHPENAHRLRAVHNALDARRAAMPWLRELPFEAATKAQLSVIHHRDYVAELDRACAFGGGMLDGDTYLTEHSFDAAALAVGSAIAATRDVLTGTVPRAMILPRPPGHHAFADHGEGFCLFNNAAFAAHEAVDVFHLDRVLIVDFDVHHGNGTESIFCDDPRVLYCSTHQWGIYPGSGRLDAIGQGPGRGCTLNVPLPAGTGDSAYLRVFDELILPVARRFAPQLLIVSAGFDAHWRDPLAGMRVGLGGFAQMVLRLLALANACCGGKTVVVLEGGYDLEALACGVLNTLHLLADGDPATVEDPIGAQLADPRTHEMVTSIIGRARAIHNL